MIRNAEGAIGGGYGYDPMLGHVTSSALFTAGARGGAINETPDYATAPGNNVNPIHFGNGSGGGATTLPVAQRTEATPGATSTPSAPSAPSNTGGAGLAGNGPLIDALMSALSGGGMQSPLDASSSPSTAAIEALAPTAQPTSSSSNTALVVLAIGGAVVVGIWLYFRHKHAKGATAQ